MEALYSKLYDKYATLKKKKLSELDEVNRDQEVKFLNYVSVAEELIQHLKDQNDRLRVQVNDLRSEVDSIRSNKDEQLAEYQKSLIEENQKNKLLSEEVEKLQKLLQEGLSCNSKDGRNENTQLNMLKAAQVPPIEVGSGPMTRTRRKHSEAAQVTPIEVSSRLKRRATRNCSQESGAQMEGAITPAFSQQPGETIARKLAKGASMGILPIGDLSKDQQLECCKKNFNGADGGGVGNDGQSAVCQFQALIEYLVGMKLSSVSQTEGDCISALHQSSGWDTLTLQCIHVLFYASAGGYSFSLTWVKKAAGEEPELLYRALTLGTFEMVAPEWMRSVLMFSMSMCPIFFERVARVIKLHR